MQTFVLVLISIKSVFQTKIFTKESAEWNLKTNIYNINIPCKMLVNLGRDNEELNPSSVVGSCWVWIGTGYTKFTMDVLLAPIVEYGGLNGSSWFDLCRDSQRKGKYESLH